jgi:hypothetical protein
MTGTRIPVCLAPVDGRDPAEVFPAADAVLKLYDGIEDDNELQYIAGELTLSLTPIGYLS